MSGGNNGQNNSRNKHSLRNNQEEDVATSYKLKPVIKYLVLTSLFWSLASHLVVILGMWDYMGGGDSADTVFTTISILFPLITIGIVLGVEID